MICVPNLKLRNTSTFVSFRYLTFYLFFCRQSIFLRIMAAFPIFRNKNATTAATQMGMSLPERPYAIVFGSHEDDVSMTDGLQGMLLCYEVHLNII